MKQLPRLALAAGLAVPLALATPAAHAQQTQVFASDERFFQEGLELFDRQQYGAAQQAMLRYMQQAPVRASAGEQSGPAATSGRQERLADAEYYYAVSGLYQQHPDAEDLILDFAERHPTHPQAAVAYFELAKFYFDQSSYTQASTYFQRVAPANLSASQRAESDFKLGYSYFQLKDYEKARPLFDRNKQEPSEYRYASAYYAGYLAFRAANYAGARKDFQLAGENEAYKTVVPNLIAQTYYKQGDYPGLIAYASKALQQTPPPQQADEMALLTGDAYYQREDYKAAAPYFDQYAAAHKGKIDAGLQYKIGFANYKQGDFAGAIASFKPVAVRRDSLGQNAAYHLGLSYLQAGQKPQALAAFDAARQSTLQKNLAENATLKYAQVEYELGNGPEVIAALRDFRRKYPRSKNQPAVDQLLSDAFLSSTDYEQALSYLESLGDERGQTLNGTYQRVAYAQAATLFNDGKYAEALPLLDKSLKYPQDDALRAAAQVLRGEIYSVGQQYPEAISAYALAARTARQGGVSEDETQYVQLARYGLGYAYYNTKAYSQAQPQFKAYVNDPAAKPSDPNYYDATLRLADTYYVAKDYNSALALYDKVIQANAPDKDYAYYQKGVTLGLLGRKDEANQTLAALLKANPDSRYAEQAVFQQAQLDFQAGDYQPAVEGFTRLITNRPTSSLLPEAYQRRGVAYANLDQQDKAVLDFQKVLSDYPRSSSAQQAISSLQESLSALGRTEEFDQALAAYKAQNPNTKATESVEFEAAKSLYLAEKYQQALPRLQAYLQDYPDNAYSPDARFLLADSYLRTGDATKALPLLRAVVDENKSEFVNRAVGRVADLELAGKNYPEAIKYYQRLRTATTTRREAATATLGLLKAYYDSGDYAKARATAQDLSTLAGATAGATNTALLYLGKADYRLGNLDQAATELRATVAAAPSDVTGAEAQYTLAEVLFKQQQYDAAITEAFKVNTSYGAYEQYQGRAFLLLADIYTAQKDIFQARATLNSIIDNKFPVTEVVEGARQRLKALPAGDGDEPAPAPTRQPPVKTPKVPAASVKTTPAPTPAPATTSPAPAKTTSPAPAKTTAPAPRTPAPLHRHPTLMRLAARENSLVKMRELKPVNTSVARKVARTAGLTLGLGAAVAAGAQAQTQPPGRGKARGTIQDAEIEVVKDRVNTLPEATRNFEKIKLAPPPKATRQLTYTYPDFRLPATRLAPVTQVLTIAPEELEPLTGNYLKLGAGNYGTFYGRAHLHSTRSNQYSYGLDVRHQSSGSGPVDGSNSAVAQTSVAATGEYYQGTAALGLSLDYARERYHFYGYDRALLTDVPSAESIQQTFNRFGVRAYARQRAPDAQVQYELGVGYQHWQDAYTSSENNFLVDAKAGYALGETSRITLQANGSFITEKESAPLTVVGEFNRARNFIQATPAYELTGKTGLSLTLGATFGYSSEPYANASSNPLGDNQNPNGVGKASINPAVRVGYNVVPEKFQLYAGAGGAIQRVTRYDLTQENPWLGYATSQTVADTHYGPTGYVGFTAAPASGLSLAARATYGRTRNLYFYRTLPSPYLNNVPAASSYINYTSVAYGLVYDSAAVGVLTVHGELLYSASDKYRVGFKADYNHYGVSSLAHPYGRPAFLGTLYGTYNATDKLLFGVDFYYYSPNYGTAYTAGYNPGGGTFYQATDRQTDAVLDLSLRAEYRVTPKFSIFALGNNLTNRRYQRFLNYPVKGINVIGGLTYSF